MDIKQEVWETQDYYDRAHIDRLDLKHPGIRLLLDLSKKSKKILDLGCGDGSRLSLLSKNGIGVDISRKAIGLAKKRYPKLDFFVGNLEKLSIKDDIFDLVYSAYVFEHLSNPEKVIAEAGRVLKKDGNLVIICPNYGSPNRASPPFRGSRIKKLFFGLFKDLIYLFKPVVNLSWYKVNPITAGYESDWDVTNEPYSLTLEKYLNMHGFWVKKNIQTWSYEMPNAKLLQKFFKMLGSFDIYPFRYWSPHIVIQAKKI